MNNQEKLMKINEYINVIKKHHITTPERHEFINSSYVELWDSFAGSKIDRFNLLKSMRQIRELTSEESNSFIELQREYEKFDEIQTYIILLVDIGNSRIVAYNLDENLCVSINTKDSEGNHIELREGMIFTARVIRIIDRKTNFKLAIEKNSLRLITIMNPNKLVKLLEKIRCTVQEPNISFGEMNSFSLRGVTYHLVNFKRSEIKRYSTKRDVIKFQVKMGKTFVDLDIKNIEKNEFNFCVGPVLVECEINDRAERPIFKAVKLFVTPKSAEELNQIQTKKIRDSSIFNNEDNEPTDKEVQSAYFDNLVEADYFLDELGNEYTITDEYDYYFEDDEYMPEEYDLLEDCECTSFANSDLEEVDDGQEYKRYKREIQEKNESLKKMEIKKAKINYIISGLKPIYLVGERCLKNYYTDFKTEEVQKLNNKQINSIPEAYALRMGEIYNISKTEIKVAFEFITDTSYICECKGCKYVIRGEGGGELIPQDTEILKGKRISEILSCVDTEDSNEIDGYEYEGFVGNIIPDCTPDVM